MYIQPYLVFSPNPADPYIISKKDKERLAWQDGPPLKIWQTLTLLKKIPHTGHTNSLDRCG